MEYMWLIQKDTEKPVDTRRKACRHEQFVALRR